jgi:hypothetical protein
MTGIQTAWVLIILAALIGLGAIGAFAARSDNEPGCLAYAIAIALVVIIATAFGRLP